MLVELYKRHSALIKIIWASIGPAGGELIADVYPARKAGRLAGDEIASYIVEMSRHKLAARHNEKKKDDILQHMYDNHPGSLLIFQCGSRVVLFGSYDVDAYASIEATRDAIISYLSHAFGDLAVLEENIKRNKMYHLRSFGQAA